MRWLFLLVLCVGCEVPTDIPCHADLECPTDWYCNGVGQCASLESSSPPNLIVPADTLRPVIPEGRFTLTVRVVNAGGSEAPSIVGSISAPDCFRASGEPKSAALGPNESTEVRFSFDRQPACPNATAEVTMEVRYGSASGFLRRQFKTTLELQGP